MTAVLEPLTVQAESPDLDPDCPKCRTFTAVVYVGTITDTVYELGEQPGPKHAWACRGCNTEWTTPAVESGPCSAGLPWCVGDCHLDAGGHYHTGAYRPVLSDRDGNYGTAEEALSINVARVDRLDGTGDPIIFVGPQEAIPRGSLTDVLGFTPASARAFALELLAAAAEVTGSKRADDLRLGDRIVLNGKVHEVVFLMIDACYHDVEVRCCAGHVQVYTDLSEAADESTPAVTLDPADLVEVAR